jgi:hypothetical protein
MRREQRDRRVTYYFGLCSLIACHNRFVFKTSSLNANN